jgi:dynein light intermediate chain 1
LEDVSVSSDKGVKSATKNVLVLGDVCSGKSTLIDRLCTITSKKGKRSNLANRYLLSGCSLEYRFIDVQDHTTDDLIARLGIWNLDGVIWQSQLLPFVLNKKNIEDTLVMIVLDLSKPWDVLDSLDKWMEVISKHINHLKLNAKQRQDMEERMVKLFQSYSDPDVSSSDVMAEGDVVALPLEENVLKCNLGLPIIIVGTKSDVFAQLEKNEKYKDEHFDFIQQHIRRFCLNYGAALFYTSTKDTKNIETLHKYLIHRVYGLKFDVPAYVVEKDAVFIPTGWDSDKKISVLCEQMKHFNPHEPLKNIIVPPSTATPLNEQADISSEDDQAFLLAQQAYLTKSSTRPQSTAQASTTNVANKDKSPRSSGTPQPDTVSSHMTSTLYRVHMTYM